MTRDPFPIPVVVVLKETTAMLAGMAGFSAIVATVVSIVYAVFRFFMGWATFEGSLGVAGGVFLACFLAYLGCEVLSERERRLRQALLLRRTGRRLFESGQYDAAARYLGRSTEQLIAYRRPGYEFLLQENRDTLARIMKIRDRAEELRRERARAAAGAAPRP